MGLHNVRSRHTPLRVNFSFVFRLYGQVKKLVTSTSGRNHSRSGRNDVGETCHIRKFCINELKTCIEL